MERSMGTVTDREVEVLMARADHPTLEAAAEALGISPNVVRSTTARLRKKLGAATDLNAYRMLHRGVRLITETSTQQRMEIADAE